MTCITRKRPTPASRREVFGCSLEVAKVVKVFEGTIVRIFKSRRSSERIAVRGYGRC